MSILVPVLTEKEWIDVMNCVTHHIKQFGMSDEFFSVSVWFTNTPGAYNIKRKLKFNTPSTEARAREIWNNNCLPVEVVRPCGCLFLEPSKFEVILSTFH